MSISLREQMVQIGLATNEQAEAAKHAKTKKNPSASKGKPRDQARDKPSGKKRPTQAKGPKNGAAAARKERAAKPASPSKAVASEPQKTAAELEAEAKRRLVKAQIKALIEEQAAKDTQGELAYSYQVGDRVRQLYTTEACRDKLASGELAITRLNRQTYLIPPTLCAQILALNPEWLIVYHDPETANAPVSNDAAEDPYQAYTVPDDLKW